MAPGNVKDNWLSARLPDGRPLFSDPDSLRHMSQMVNMINPMGTIAPTGEGGQLTNINDRIAEIDKMMRTHREAYNKDEAVQEEYRKLIDARNRMAPAK